MPGGTKSVPPPRRRNISKALLNALVNAARPAPGRPPKSAKLMIAEGTTAPPMSPTFPLAFILGGVFCKNRGSDDIKLAFKPATSKARRVTRSMDIRYTRKVGQTYVLQLARHVFL